MFKFWKIFQQKFDDNVQYDKVSTSENNEHNDVSRIAQRNNDGEFDDEEHLKTNHKISSSNAFWNVCNSIQGVAILAMPYIIKGGGWWSVVAMVIVAAISNYTGQILIKCHYDEIHEDSNSIVYVRTRYENNEVILKFFFFQTFEYFIFSIGGLLERSLTNSLQSFRVLTKLLLPFSFLDATMRILEKRYGRTTEKS